MILWHISFKISPLESKCYQCKVNMDWSILFEPPHTIIWLVFLETIEVYQLQNTSLLLHFLSVMSSSLLALFFWLIGLILFVLKCMRFYKCYFCFKVCCYEMYEYAFFYYEGLLWILLPTLVPKPKNEVLFVILFLDLSVLAYVD